MLDKCSNPSCSAPFLYLQEGKLFRLEIDPAINHRAGPDEYFWLCDDCSSKMTLCLGEGEAEVVAVPLPEATHRVADGIAPVSADRKRGLFLQSVRFRLPEEVRARTKIRRIGEHRVA